MFTLKQPRRVALLSGAGLRDARVAIAAAPRPGMSDSPVRDGILLPTG